MMDLDEISETIDSVRDVNALHEIVKLLISLLKCDCGMDLSPGRCPVCDNDD